MTDSSQLLSDLFHTQRALGQVLIGQQALIDRLLIGLLTGGHLLLEGVPGLAKTLAARSLAQATGLPYQRVQFTPDLLPADLLGTEIYHPGSGDFRVRKGPLFTQILLADEINRAPAKVQSALLEAMQEGQITLGQETFNLPTPYLVLATQNPVEHEGTYALPEAQVDRFLLKVLVNYPSRADEESIVKTMGRLNPQTALAPSLDAEKILALRELVDSIHCDDKIVSYIVDLVRSTRPEERANPELNEWIQMGASPRAGISLVMAAKAMACLQGRDYVIPHDVKTMAPDVLRHRIVPSFEAEAEEITSDQIVVRLLDLMPVP